MFFILSKILLFLIMPFTVISLLLIASVIVKNQRWKKILFRTSFVMLLFFSNDFIANEAMRAWEVDPKPYSTMPKYKLGIVLTGATISGLDPKDRVYFQRGADRVVHTVELYKKGLIEKILISGGVGQIIEDNDEPEANKFRKVMLLMGVPESDIIIENQTRNTAESAIEVKKLLEQFGYNSSECVLITSAFHMRRSLLSYEKNGLVLESFSTDFYAHPTSFDVDGLIIPKIDAMLKWHKLSKEWVGIIAYKIVGYV